MENIYIQSVVRITNAELIVDGSPLLARERTDCSWPVEMYKKLNLQYPKFFKMDNLSKVGFLAAELVMKGCSHLEGEDKPDFSVLLINSCSSLDNDLSYQKTISDENNYFPSPAVFVYTLANIVTGEIAIRHKIKGETAFFIEEKFSAETIYHLSKIGFVKEKGIRELLIGWVDYLDDNCDLLLFRISTRSENSIAKWTEEELMRWYRCNQII